MMDQLLERCQMSVHIVGSGTVVRWFAGILTLGNGVTIKEWFLFQGDLLLRNSPLVYDKHFASCNNGKLLCKAAEGILLCNRGDIWDQMDHILVLDTRGAILVHSDSLPFRYKI